MALTAPNSPHVADLPDKLTLAQNRDRAARHEPWFRRLGLSLLVLLCLLGLANLFGQRKQIPKLEQIQWAVLETGGQISFIKKT